MHAQEKDASLQRARAAARAAEDRREQDLAAAAQQPLDASQRAVIRDLSLKVAHLTRCLTGTRSERDQLQVRCVWLLKTCVRMFHPRVSKIDRPASWYLPRWQAS